MAFPTLEPPVHPEGFTPATFCFRWMQHSTPRLWISTNAAGCQECSRIRVFCSKTPIPKLCCPTGNSGSSNQQCSPAAAPPTAVHSELETAGKPGNQGTGFGSTSGTNQADVDTTINPFLPLLSHLIKQGHERADPLTACVSTRGAHRNKFGNQHY